MTSESVNVEFSAIRSTYEAMATRVQNLVSDLLEGAGIDLIQLDSRAKTVESFNEKVRRKGYDRPLQQMTDLVGVRIVLYYLEDVKEVERLLRAEFDVDDANSPNKADEMDPDQFGYLSRHFVLTLSPSRAKLIEWRAFHGIKFEIQVRTALQHAWAAINHKLEYKSAQEVPRELRRGLYRLSALFEIADAQFSAFRIDSQRVQEAYGEHLERGDTDIAVDSNSLRAYFADRSFRYRLESIARRVPWGIKRESDQERQDRGILMEFCHALQWDSVEGIDKALALEDSIIEGMLKTMRRGLLEHEGWTDFGTLEDVVNTIILIRYRGAGPAIVDRYYPEPTQRAIKLTQSEFAEYVTDVTS